jgi:hypothetical protein
MKLMCHGMEALALAAVRINAKMGARWRVEWLFSLLACVVEKRRSATNAFSLDSCVL